jgi:hypothetical protein
MAIWRARSIAACKPGPVRLTEVQPTGLRSRQLNLAVGKAQHIAFDLRVGGLGQCLVGFSRQTQDSDRPVEKAR